MNKELLKRYLKETGLFRLVDKNLILGTYFIQTLGSYSVESIGKSEPVWFVKVRKMIGYNNKVVFDKYVNEIWKENPENYKEKDVISKENLSIYDVDKYLGDDKEGEEFLYSLIADDFNITEELLEEVYIEKIDTEINAMEMAIESYRNEIKKLNGRIIELNVEKDEIKSFSTDNKNPKSIN